jgi:uncharacterized membrane protein
VYLALKLLHVAAVILFLGNITTGLFWKAHGDRSGDARIMAHTLDGIIRSDRLFTIPGVLAITAAGIAAALEGDLPILGTGWIWQSIVLFSLSGMAFVWRIAPLQVRLRALAREGAERGGLDEAQYRRVSRAWELWGLVGVLAPVGALALMVLKPA